MSAELCRRALAEQLADSVQRPLPMLIPRKIYSTASLPGKAMAVIGMRGRGWEVIIYPFSFEEYLRNRSQVSDRG